ncbi:MAG: HEAT repeat domain-containing protein [Gemmataceae bacterium]|nr:HEAT repeat domain-containing protein [Gemmataceae bacterium]
MSIAVLTQVYDEMRRLAIAGSVVASGDFRLKKLIPALEQAGAKAPVFAKVADAVKAVVNSEERTSGQALLELTTLVNAILYTQGETGASGTLEPIETAELVGPTSQASARVLKPLLEALTTTGSGRLELVRDAYERGAFHDLRLVQPALKALDDVYPEIGDFIADKVLTLYGKAIVPDLRARFDLKGRGGHSRRLRLLHALDPAGSRDLVKQSLETGSKEVKVVAIECLGAEPEDLSYLIEQASAKAQEVRQAAYRALATIDDEAAVAVLQKAMDGKELHLAADSLNKSRNAKVLSYLIAAIEGELAAVRKSKEKKEIGQKIGRILALVSCLSGREDKDSEGFLLNVFADRSELAKIKGDNASGVDLNSVIVRIMEQGTKKLRQTLVDAHATLPAHDLKSCFQAARHVMPADKVYAVFSPYVTAKVDDKKKQRDPAWYKREAIFAAIADRYYYDPESNRQEKAPELDGRWLDRAVEMVNLSLVRQLIRPGNAKANAFLSEVFNDIIKNAKHMHDCQEVVASMIYAAHPEATDAFLAVLEKFNKKTDYYFGYWLGSLVLDLPKSAIPRLEAMLPKLNDKIADHLLGYIQQLREKKD